VGAIQQMLLADHAAGVTAVDASSAYLETARAEAARLGHEGKVSFHHGNFVDLAPTVPDADIVTLDRVICCYDDMNGLVAASVAKARALYALVFPRSGWFARRGVALANLFMGIRGNPFRIFAHETERIEAVIARAGLTRVYRRTAGIWQVVVWARTEAA
jgi:hypothetical protein